MRRHFPCGLVIPSTFTLNVFTLNMGWFCTSLKTWTFDRSFKITPPQTCSMNTHACNSTLSLGGYVHANVLFLTDRCFTWRTAPIFSTGRCFLNGNFISSPCFPSFALASKKQALLNLASILQPNDARWQEYIQYFVLSTARLRLVFRRLRGNFCQLYLTTRLSKPASHACKKGKL